ncbi:MAG TPA: bifunctional nicotinamidase/pyrazinamidase [Cyclobacteriaceae bacterium]|nr:bifunctional nicotinamidase/pyrazinamidase [Cyclobacteriaceae bacterium]
MKALIVVDIQNDFLEGGALAVPGGDEIIPLVNSLMPPFELVVATKDWHPADHGSFADNHPDKRPGDMIELNGLQQVLWPTHCVQDTRGSEFSPHLQSKYIHKVIFKGTDPGIDSYSGFYDNGHRKSTGLSVYLKDLGVKEVTVAGLAADYCVKFTALDSMNEGFKTILIEDATRAVNLRDGDFERSLLTMKNAGVLIVKSSSLKI